MVGAATPAIHFVERIGNTWKVKDPQIEHYRGRVGHDCSKHLARSLSGAFASSTATFNQWPSIRSRPVHARAVRTPAAPGGERDGRVADFWVHGEALQIVNDGDESRSAATRIEFFDGLTTQRVVAAKQAAASVWVAHSRVARASPTGHLRPLGARWGAETDTVQDWAQSLVIRHQGPERRQLRSPITCRSKALTSIERCTFVSGHSALAGQVAVRLAPEVIGCTRPLRTSAALNSEDSHDHASRAA